jgi:hypothetical protein
MHLHAPTFNELHYLSSFQMKTNNGYESVLSTRARKHRRQRRVRKQKEELAKEAAHLE